MGVTAKNIELFRPLPNKKLVGEKFDKCGWIKRVLFFDAIFIFERLNLKPNKRTHDVSIERVFLPKKGECACGCGQKLTGRQRRWASVDCANFAFAVTEIIRGRSPMIARYMNYYYGWNCFECGCEDKGHDMGYNGTVSWIKVDHIIPVKLGGGACWLSNYQLLCHDCHVMKTKKDFNWKEFNKDAAEKKK